MEQQFVFMKITMARWTITYGLWLIGWAAAVVVATGSESITSWIPAMLGIPILLMVLMSLIRPAASASKLMLLVTGAWFAAICLRSFIWARKNPRD